MESRLARPPYRQAPLTPTHHKQSAAGTPVASPCTAQSFLGGEVVIAKHTFLIVVAIVLWEKALLAEEIVGREEHWLSNFQRKDSLVSVGLHHTGGHGLIPFHHLPGELIKDNLQPLLTGDVAVL